MMAPICLLFLCTPPSYRLQKTTMSFPIILPMEEEEEEEEE
jgi:hypothetical protein